MLSLFENSWITYKFLSRSFVSSFLKFFNNITNLNYILHTCCYIKKETILKLFKKFKNIIIYLRKTNKNTSYFFYITIISFLKLKLKILNLKDKMSGQLIKKYN